MLTMTEREQRTKYMTDRQTTLSGSLYGERDHRGFVFSRHKDFLPSEAINGGSPIDPLIKSVMMLSSLS